MPDRGIGLRASSARRDDAGWKQTANSDVVVITSGVPRKPGMSRDDLLNVNYKIMQSVTEQVVKYSPNCIIVPVANPLDAMCQAVYRLSKFPRERVIGMAGVLDSARMRTFIAMETERLGREHPRVRARRPRRHDGAAAALLDGRRHPDHRTDRARRRRIDAICERTADGGAEITKLVGTSAWYAPGAAAAEMVESDPARTRRRSCRARCSCRASTASTICSSACRCKLGARGVEQIIQIKLTAEEDAALQEVGGGGQGTDRRHQGLSSSVSPPVGSPAASLSSS